MSLRLESDNDKTYRNHHTWEVEEGWRYSIQLKIAGLRLQTYTCGEDIPGEGRWGTIFTAQDGDLVVNPDTGAVTVLASECLKPRSAVAALEPQWMSAVKWCATDTGPEDCPDRYRKDDTTKACLSADHRRCLIRTAMSLALRDECERAIQAVRTCQCHNPSRMLKKSRIVQRRSAERVQ